MTKKNKRNRSITILALSAAAVASAAVGACLLPDNDIRFVDNDCGEVWGVQAIGAYAYDAFGEKRDIKDENGEWLEIRYCYGASQAADAADPNSQLYGWMIIEMVELCEDRASILGWVDSDGSCFTEANVVDFGQSCALHPTQCDGPGGADTGADEVPPDLPAGQGFDDLDLTTLITTTRGVTTIEQQVLDVGVSDPYGVHNEVSVDSITQVMGPTGAPAGYKWNSCPTDSVCDLLGFQVNDVVIEVGGNPTTNLADVLEANDALIGTTSFTAKVERAAGVTTLNFAIQ